MISPLLDEIAARYDPQVRVIPGIGSLGDFLEFQALPAWRETAWRNAELLASAPGPAARKLVAATIEQDGRRRGDGHAHAHALPASAHHLREPGRLLRSRTVGR